MASLPLPLVPPSVASVIPAHATEEERQPLVDPEDIQEPETPTTDGRTIEEMGMKDSYDRPEGRNGDAQAQVAAIVRHNATSPVFGCN